MEERIHPLLVSKGKKKRRGIVKICRFCKSEFYAGPCHSKRVYCCQGHMIQWMQKMAFRFVCVVCGKTVFTQPAQIKYRHRKTCSIICRGIYVRKMAEKRRIENGYTKHQIDRLARYSPEAQTWRSSVFKRDNWTCQLCQKRGERLEADHIKPWAYFPNLRFELANGRTLCRKCHDKTKISYKKMREIYGKL